MNDVKMKTRTWLRESTKSQFHSILEEAKLTPRQMEIVELRFAKGLMNYQIAMEMNLSVQTVEREISNVYAAITRILLTAD